VLASENRIRVFVTIFVIERYGVDLENEIDFFVRRLHQVLAQVVDDFGQIVGEQIDRLDELLHFLERLDRDSDFLAEDEMLIQSRNPVAQTKHDRNERTYSRSDNRHALQPRLHVLVTPASITAIFSLRHCKTPSFFQSPCFRVIEWTNYPREAYRKPHP